jgi:hypothetical protein
VDFVYASSEVDEYGHPRFGGISGIVASEIYNKLKIEARSQITGYYARSGDCREYDRRLTMTLADKVVDLLLREDYGQMPVMSKIVPYEQLEEFNTSSIDMGKIGNWELPEEYYDVNRFKFTDTYSDFLSYILKHPVHTDFEYDFPVIIPE